MTSDITVFHYNVLANPLRTKYMFPHVPCITNDQANEALKAILSIQCNRGAIICLQEITQTMRCMLHVWFEERSYRVVATNTGNSYNGYMGTLIAYPEHMQLKTLQIGKPSTLMGNRPDDTLTTWDTLCVWARRTFHKFGICEAPKPTPYDLICRRWNDLIILRLKNGDQFWNIGTYHMPCLHWAPEAQNLHCMAINKAFCAMNINSEPQILTIDGNYKPDTLPHKTMLNKWQVVDHSAPYTCMSQSNRPNNEPFYPLTIDYIYYRNASESHSHYQQAMDMFNPSDYAHPSEQNPSDHLYLSACFEAFN